jgi:hypothetical protein
MMPALFWIRATVSRILTHNLGHPAECIGDIPMCASTSSVRPDHVTVPPAAQRLHAQFTRDGFRAIAVALLSDLNAIAENGCPSCERQGTVEAMPYHNGKCWRIAVICHDCGHSFEA